MSKSLKQAKAIFGEIATIAYELDNDELNQAMVEMQREVKNELSVSVIQEYIDEITTLINNIDVDNEILSELDDLYAQLLEL